ncbi:GNAT family N-acetyltransferase [Thiotrichales bacterium 19X7-9]|nr:GNAT family N-acetyltransferase [Thiotrichales bacterium 19X7-9]
MKNKLWDEEPISKDHNRENFDCGDHDLNMFLKQHARRTHERGGAKTFLAIEKNNSEILGYYTLSPASISYENAPDEIKKQLARHDVPVFRLCRLAIDINFQKMGLGGQLLLAAGKRCLKVSTEVGGVAMLIDAKNDQVAKWYASYGALQLEDNPLSLIIPLKTIKNALNNSI